MTEPVTMSTGQTYNRASIQERLDSGRRTCPKTGSKLTNTDLVPNTTLGTLIQQFCVDNGVSQTKLSKPSRDVTETIHPGSPAESHAIQFLSSSLARMLQFGTTDQKNKAAYEICLLTRSNIFNLKCLVQSGTVSRLLILFSTNDKSMQENAVTALMTLSKIAKGEGDLMEHGGLEPILTVIKNGLTPESRENAALIIFILASEYKRREVIGENPEAIASLVELIKEGASGQKKNAARAIFGLLFIPYCPKNHQRLVEANPVPALLDALASSGDDDVTTEVLRALAAIAGASEGAEALLKASAQPLITGIFKSTEIIASKEQCASILLSLCENGGEEVISVLAKDTSIMPMLYLLYSDETCIERYGAGNHIKRFDPTTISVLMTSSIVDDPLMFNDDLY